MFWRNMSPPLSESKSKPSKKSGKVGGVLSLLPETWDFLWTMWCYNSEDHTFHSHCCKNLRSKKNLPFFPSLYSPTQVFTCQVIYIIVVVVVIIIFRHVMICSSSKFVWLICPSLCISSQVPSFWFVLGFSPETFGKYFTCQYLEFKLCIHFKGLN
jgi:uncharacterized membrane protein YbaN (DUF454 family)